MYLWAEVADYVESLIRSGTLAPGARLPGERELAGQLGVAIGTVRRALAELKARQLVTTLPSKGTFILAPPAHN